VRHALRVRDHGLDARGLRSRVSGSVSVPGDDDWDIARRAWNLAVDQRPAAVVHAQSAADVVAVVDAARQQGLAVAPQGTGHAAAALGTLDDAILLKTSRMRGVGINPLARIARVEAGVIWLEATMAAGKHGLTALAGSAPDIGVVGYTLGGGIGWLARSLGLAANSVEAVELVTADGELVRADRDTEPDLFWAVRGGGGNVGVVTALEFRLHPILDVYAGSLFWPLERASEILHAWREWVAVVPDELTSVGRILRFPAIQDIPEPVRGRSFVVVEAAFIGDEREGVELLRPLRELGPVLDLVDTMPAVALTTVHMNPDRPVPRAGDGMLLADLPAEAVDAFVAAAGSGSGSPLVSAEIHHLGGELARPAAEHGALASIDAGFAMYAVGVAADDATKAAVVEHVDAVRGALGPWDAGRSYLNFAERRTDPRRLFTEQAFHRLRRVKAHYDPAGLIRANHPIPAAV
jgi:FAD/FMN-containing dehydrogenase